MRHPLLKYVYFKYGRSYRMSKSLFKAQRDNEVVYHMLIKYSLRDWLMEFPNIYLQGFEVMEHGVMKLVA